MGVLGSIAMEGFHPRWMPSTVALRAWVARVCALSLLCPQHGSTFRRKAVGQLPDRLEGLEVGQWQDDEAGAKDARKGRLAA